DALEAVGLSVWFSEKNVVLGAPLMREIDRGLSKSRAGLVLSVGGRRLRQRDSLKGSRAADELGTICFADRRDPIEQGDTRHEPVIALARLVVRVERFILDRYVKELSPTMEAPHPHPHRILLEVGVARYISDPVLFRDLPNG